MIRHANILIKRLLAGGKFVLPAMFEIAIKLEHLLVSQAVAKISGKAIQTCLCAVATINDREIPRGPWQVCVVLSVWHVSGKLLGY